MPQESSSAEAETPRPDLPDDPPVEPREPADDLERVVLRLHETSELADRGLSITWSDLEDSRCPEGVTCVWAGEARLGLAVTEDGSVRQVTLVVPNGGNGAPVETAHWRLRGLAVEPYPRQGVTPEPSQYRAVIEVGSR